MAKHHSVRILFYAAFVSSLLLITYALFHLSQRAVVMQSSGDLSEKVGSPSPFAVDTDGSNHEAQAKLPATDGKAGVLEHDQMKTSFVKSDEKLSIPDKEKTVNMNSAGLSAHLDIDSESESTPPPAFEDEEHHHGEGCYSFC
jgi:hypothetical protein